MPVGFSKACRTCLTLDGTLISIYDSISYDGRGRVTDMIKDITKIKPMKSDGLPELVCQTCLNEINRCYSFKVKCLNSDSTLRKLFATEEELEAPTQQQVVYEEKEYKPIIENLIRLHGPDELELEYEPPVKIKTEKDQDDQSFGYFVITSVCSQIDQTNGDGSEETIKTFQMPQGYIKEEIDYEIDSYNTSSTRRLTFSDVCASDQSQCFDNISLELACPEVKLEPEDQEPIQLEPPVINSTIKPSFNCTKCGKEFLYISRLKKHMRSHNSKPFVCSTCSKGFKLSVQLRNHIDITHRNIKPFKCEECPRTFSFPSKLKEHLRSHKGNKYFKNNYSPSRTLIDKKENEELTQLNTGIECTNEQKPELKCDENTNSTNTNLDESIKEQPAVWTNERFTRRSARIHREEIKSPDSGKNEIPTNSSASETGGTKIKTRLSEKLTQIDYSFDGQDQNPDDKSISEGARQYNCPHCTKVFKYVSRLNEHMVCHSDARPFDCINCGKFFKTPGQLARHIKTSHKLSSFRGRRKPFSKRRGLKRKNVNKNYLRNIIEPSSKSLENADDHVNENENKDEQTNLTNTNTLDEDILDNESLKEQTNETSNSLPEKDTKATKTTRKNKSNQFNSPSKRLKQTNIENASENPENLENPDVLQESYETIENISTDEPPTYHCEQCDETFIVSARFYKHMRGHGIERPFLCSLCGKGFKNVGNLKSHIVITHKKLKPFKCNDCKRAFSCKSNLNKHLTSRIWTHSCTKEFNGRRGGSKKKIKIKKEEKDLKDSKSKQKQKIPLIEDKNENEIINDVKVKQKQKCPTEDIVDDSSQVHVQEPDVVGDNKDTTYFAEPESVEVSPDLSNAEPEKDPEQLNQPKQSEEISANKKPKNRLECPQCKKVFIYVSYLKKHLQSHSDERPFICTICDKAFKYKVSLKSHNMITHAKIKPYKCDKCPQAFVNEYTYRVHRNSHNKAIKRKAKTKRRRAHTKPHIAESTSTSVDQSVNNLNAELVTGEIKNDLTSCSVCSISIQSENLTEHMHQYHSNAESMCAPVNPTNHSNQAENQSSFVCPECKKVFVFASYLKKHMRSHNHERPYICSTCGKAFKDQWRLRSHIKTKHNSHSKKNSHRKKRRNLNHEKPLINIFSNTDAQNAKVEETSEISNIPQDLMNLNLNEEHSQDKSFNLDIQTVATISKEAEVPNAEIVKPQCTQCDRVFQFASQLETHMRTHTGERPFACPTCNKTFTQNGHLKNHVLINHKKIMPFQCSVCLRGFASGFNMRAHEKTHFNDRRKKVKSKIKSNAKLKQDHEEQSKVETSRETNQNAQDELQDQVIQDFEKLELHPLFGSMSSNRDEKTNNEQNSFYPCPDCKKTFVFHSDLNEHMQTHSPNARPFNCSICYKTFKQEAHLKNHTQMSHTKTRNYKCSECDRVFLTFYILNKHMRSHKGKKNRSKVKSKRGHKKRVNYHKHSEYSEQLCTSIEEDEINEQSVCNEEVTETVNISKNQIQTETAIARKNIQITCALCSVSVDSDSLTDHMKECLSISQSTSMELKSEPLEDPQHMGHPLFETLSNQDEQQTDTGIAKQCSECKQEFSSYSLLAEHMRTHKVERPFICTTCGKGFKKNAHLKSHIMIVHKRILPFKCIDCSRAFSSKYNLQMHLKTHMKAKGNMKKGSSKRRVIVKKSYYKDPTYHAKPIHNESAHQTTTRDSKQNEIKEDDTINYTIQNQMQQREIQYSYGRNENKIRCTLCFVSVHTENLSKHMQEFHNLPDSLSCMAIKKEPLEQSEQLEHQSMETESIQTSSNIDASRRLQCPTCDKEFIHLSRLNEHMRAHSDERPFICLFCGKTFKRHGHLTTHIAMCHKKAKPFKCKECQETFLNSLDLDEHLQTHINEQLPTGFLVDANLQNDINLEPTQNDEPLPSCNIGAMGECTTEETHQCTFCPTVFKSISHLMEHMKVHTSDQPFICSLCGKGFSSNDDLSTHRSIRHNKSKPYQCDQCVRKFRTSLELKKHLLVHASNSQRMQKLMRRKRQNKKHNLDLNNQEPLSYSEDAPHCHICKKNFTNNWVLKEHMKCHTTERPFVCPICGHGFSKKYNLKIHIMAHKKIKPFKCHFCPQSYCTNSGLTHHMRTHTHGRKRIDIDLFNSENLTL